MIKKVLRIILGSVLSFLVFSFISLATPQQSLAYYAVCYLPPMVVVCKDIPYFPDVCAPTVFCGRSSQHFDTLSELKQLVSDSQEAAEAICRGAGFAGLPWAQSNICENVPGIPHGPTSQTNCESLTALGKDICEEKELNGNKCFWYSGGFTDSPRCVVNSGNMNSDASCRDKGHCYHGQYCQRSQYCSSFDQGPIGGIPEQKDSLCAEQGYLCQRADDCVSQNYKDPTAACKANGAAKVCCKVTSSPTPKTGGGGTTGGGGDKAPALTPCGGTCGTQSTPPAASSCAGNNWNYAGPTGNSWCASKGGGTNYCYTCVPAGAGGGTRAPSTPQGPTSGPCKGTRGGVLNYVGPLCGSKTWNEFDAKAGAFCSLVYKDQYMCNDGKTDDFEVLVQDQNYNGKQTCAQSPWCISREASSPTPTDSPNCRTQGLDCGGSITCCSSQNLECNSITATTKTCQYIGGKSFTPTPGLPNSSGCKFGQASIGCVCPSGGECAPSLGCYPAADSTGIKTTDNPNGQYCAPSGGRWCQKKATVADPAACNTGSSYTPTVAPKDLGYQADCPNVNSDGSTNACLLVTTCPSGYTQQGPGIGGTNGNKVCTEFEGGHVSTCCRRNAGSNPAPAVSSAPTPTSSGGSGGAGGSGGGSTSTTCNSTTEQCQAGIDGNTNETCVTGWSNVGKRNCTLNTTCCKQN